MSFALTTAQFRARTKTVTRRIGWAFLKAGDRVCGVVKSQGLKKGEQIERLGTIRVVSNTPQRIDEIDQADVIREGFPGMTPAEFVAMFCEHSGYPANAIIHRIEFAYED